jgi:ankyrin repeat protein
LKDLVVKQTSSPKKQPTANNSGGLQPLINIKSTPEGAQVSLNGASVGITTSSGLRIPWKHGLSIVITKSGFATETLNFAEPPDNSEITIKLKSAFRLFTNPWGASVLVDGKHRGVTDRDGLVVPWDGATIGIEKAGYKSESLKFVSPPTENQSSVELQPAISSVAPKRHPLEVVGYAMAAIVLWLLPLFIYSFTVNRSGLERDIGEKDREIARLTQAEKALRIDFDKQVSNFRSQVKTKDAEIEKLSQSEKEVIALRSDLNKKDAEITKLIQLDQEKSRLIAELRSDKSLSRLSPALSAPKGQAGQSTNMQLISNARDGNVNHVRALLTQGADPNFRNDGGYTALILASIYGHSEVVKTLLKGGANKDLSYYGWTALDFAKNHNHPVIVTLLNPRGAPPPSPANPAKDKELFAAAQSGDPNIVSVLLSNGANVNARDANGLTPLIVASYQGSWPMINELLKKGADVNLRSNIGKTALMVATQNGHEPVVKLLIEKGANVNVESDRNETALMLAVNMGYKKIANLLRQNGAKN